MNLDGFSVEQLERMSAAYANMATVQHEPSKVGYCEAMADRCLIAAGLPPLRQKGRKKK